MKKISFISALILFPLFSVFADTIEEQRSAFLKKDLSHITDKHKMVHFKAPADYDHCPKMAYCHVKNTKVLHVMRNFEKTIYDVSYDFDEYRRRTTPYKKKGKSHLIMTGCSFVFGTGLKEDETLPYFLAKSLNDYTPYNYGLAGSGTNSMTAQVQFQIDRESVPEEEGIFIYTLLDFHVPRSNALAMEREWLWDTPHYDFVNGDVKYTGTYKTSEPIRTTFYHSTQAVLKFFGVKLNYPPLRKHHQRFTCHLIRKARQEYKAKFPKGRFVVFDHPFDEISPSLFSCLKEHNIEYYKSKYPKDMKDYIPLDGHPSASLNKKLSIELQEYLSDPKLRPLSF